MPRMREGGFVEIEPKIRIDVDKTCAYMILKGFIKDRVDVMDISNDVRNSFQNELMENLDYLYNN